MAETTIDEEKPKKKSRAAYFREYRKKHKQELRDYQNKRNAENPERKSRYNKAYLEKVKLEKLQLTAESEKISDE